MSPLVATGEPACEALVAAQVARIGERVAGLPGLRALYLMGSFGRGEGTARLDPGGGVLLLSDYELAAVAPRLDRPLRAGLAAAQRDLAAELGVELSVALFTERRLRAGLRRNLSWGRQPLSIVQYDLARGSLLLWGRALDWGRLEAAEIHPWEGVRLLVNRMAEALEHRAWEDREEAVYRRDKCLIAAGDAALVGAGLYAARYRERLGRLAVGQGELEPGERALVLEAYRRKLGLAAGESPGFGVVQALTLRALDRASRRALGLGASDPRAFARRYPEIMQHRPEGDLYRLGPVAPAPLQNAILLGRKGLWRRLPADLLLHPGTKWFHAIHGAIPLCFAAAPPLGAPLHDRDLFRLGSDAGEAGRFEAARAALVDLWHQLCQ